MTPEGELRVVYWVIGIFIVVLLVFMVSTVVILKKTDVGTGMSFNEGLDAYTCQSCGHEYLSESINNGLLFYCVNCDPIAYKEENGEPFLVRTEQQISTTHGNEGGEI